jgi:hypothetical protein
MSVHRSSQSFSSFIQNPYEEYRLQKAGEKKQKTEIQLVVPPGNEKILYLNRLAKQYPFCICYKGKDGDLL